MPPQRSGAKTLVLHLWERPTADREIERNLERLPMCLDMASAYGLALAVETIPGDDGTPLTNVQLALERDPRCRVTLDTEFLGPLRRARGEHLPPSGSGRNGAVQHVHIKDFDGRLRRGGRRRYLLPGEGRLDLQGFLNGLAERGYTGGLTVEATAVGDDGGSTRRACRKWPLS